MNLQQRRRAFTLVELLVVIAIIALLAAILFPVFASARDRARASSCQSNMKQLGLGVLQYTQDYDERLYFRAGASANTTGTSSRVGPTTGGNPQLWWNQLYPYIKSYQVFACPSDGKPSDSAIDASTTFKRSYIASAAAEGLSSAQMQDASQEIVISEKWSTLADGTSANNESWFESFDGDMNPDARNPEYKMAKFASRHQGGMECAFFDGHAKWLRPEAITSSALLSGCALINAFPNKSGTSTKECTSNASTGCGATPNSTVPFNADYNFSPSAKPSLCENPTWIANYPTP